MRHRSNDAAVLVSSVLLIACGGLIVTLSPITLVPILYTIVAAILISRVIVCRVSNAKRLGRSQALEGAEQLVERWLRSQDRTPGD